MTDGFPDLPYECASCGDPTDKITSGSPECWRCWNWRKLDGNAAVHWHKVASLFLSNIDAYDSMTFMPKRVGLTEDEWRIMLEAANKVRLECERMLLEHGAKQEQLDKRVQTLYQNL